MEDLAQWRPEPESNDEAESGCMEEEKDGRLQGEVEGSDMIIERCRWMMCHAKYEDKDEEEERSCVRRQTLGWFFTAEGREHVREIVGRVDRPEEVESCNWVMGETL